MPAGTQTWSLRPCRRLGLLRAAELKFPIIVIIALQLYAEMLQSDIVLASKACWRSDKYNSRRFGLRILLHIAEFRELEGNDWRLTVDT